MLTKWYAHGFFGYWRQPLNCFDGSLVFLIIIDFILTAVADWIGLSDEPVRQKEGDADGLQQWVEQWRAGSWYKCGHRKAPRCN